MLVRPSGRFYFQVRGRNYTAFPDSDGYVVSLRGESVARFVPVGDLWSVVRVLDDRRRQVVGGPKTLDAACKALGKAVAYSEDVLDLQCHLEAAC